MVIVISVSDCATPWRREESFRFNPNSVNCRRICALQCACNNVRIVLIKVSILYEGDDVSEDEFCLQLSVLLMILSNASPKDSLYAVETAMLVFSTIAVTLQD
jgi:hypothetical protein